MSDAEELERYIEFALLLSKLPDETVQRLNVVMEHMLANEMLAATRETHAMWLDAGLEPNPELLERMHPGWSTMQP